MTLSDRIISGLKTMLLIQEQVARLEASQKALQEAFRTMIEGHERRLTRIETVIEIARSDRAVLRFAPQVPHQSKKQNTKGKDVND
jgi:hypothetical protein